MKHLRKFNELVSYGLRDDINDICLELNDIGFNSHYAAYTLSGDFAVTYDVVYIEKENHRAYFAYTEIEEVVNRLLEFLISSGYNHFKFRTECGWIIKMDDEIKKTPQKIFSDTDDNCSYTKEELKSGINFPDWWKEPMIIRSFKLIFEK